MAKKNFTEGLGNIKTEDPRSTSPRIVPSSNENKQFTPHEDGTPLNEDSPAISKKRAGRPKSKTEQTKTISVAIPISILEKMKIAKIKYGDNLTAYVNVLISDDLKAHYDDYKAIYDVVNK